MTLSPAPPASLEDTGPTRVPASERAARPRVVVLGAGPAGAGAAYRLARLALARPTVLELRDGVGGNAGSFTLHGVHCDYGSHRLHPVVDPVVMRDLRELLGDDLQLRVRHGRILLRGRWIHFPLKPLDLLLRLPKTFALGVAADTARKVLPRPSRGPETFASVLERGLGATICREFYFPYARKLWGVEPEELAATTAQRRVSGSSVAKILRKVAAQVPGLRPAHAGRFWYPRRGYGQISAALHEAAEREGAEFLFRSRVTGIERDGQRVTGVRYEKDGEERGIRTDHVWSTLPVSLVASMMRPQPPAEVLQAAASVAFRGMILVYLVLEQDRFSAFDAYYFPETAIPISRMSEPKNFFGSPEPRGCTVLCAELPCDPGSAEWEMNDEDLGRQLLEWLDRAGLPVRAPVREVVTRRLRQAYPVYRRGFEAHLDTLERWLTDIEGLLTFGRQGLFAHDNTHHTLYTAYAAAACFAPDGTFDEERWRAFRRVFETHVVED
ncbi:MAG: NAD(P)/FAD-dependent oxidoreductase [Gemmatimonadota bacterium]